MKTTDLCVCAQCCGATYLSGRTSETLTVVLDQETSLVFRGVVNDDRSARS
jgi:hypothetical protein